MKDWAHSFHLNGDTITKFTGIFAQTAAKQALLALVEQELEKLEEE